MGLADYNKKFDFKDFFILLILILICESSLLFEFLLEKEIRLYIWKYSFIFDLLFIILLLLNKIIKSNIFYTIATFFNPAFRLMFNLAFGLIIRFFGFNYSWFIPIVIIYFSIYLLILIPDDKLVIINKFFVDSKVISIGLVLLGFFIAFDNNRYVLRYKVPGSFREMSGILRAGIGVIILNFYFIVLAVSSIKKSYKKFDNEKLRKKGFVEE